MIPIHLLLSRIRWDPVFGRGDFVLGYRDRVLNEIVRVPLAEVIFPPDRGDLILVRDREGVVQSIPLHRIREVFRDKQLIWRRSA